MHFQCRFHRFLLSQVEMPRLDRIGKITLRTQMCLFLWYVFHILDNCPNFDSTIIRQVDSSDRQRIGESTGEFNELLKDEKLKSVPIIVLANKQDLESALKASEVAELIGLVKLKDRDWQIQACSALEATGLQEAMDWICKCVKK